MGFVYAFIDIFSDMALFMLIGMILTGILNGVMKKDMVARHLGPGSRLPSVKAALMGVPLPLCSCGVLPTTIFLGQSGASTSAVMAFLISTPQTGVDSIIATLGMMGVVFAVYRPVAAFISGAAGGAVIQWIAGKKAVSEFKDADVSCEDGHCCAAELEPAEKLTLGARIKGMAQYAFFDFMDDIAVHFLIGVLVAAAITLVLPTDFFTNIAIGSGILGMLVMLIIGLPMYICSTSSIPIALVLMAKGISPGAAFVFLFAGPATNAASLSVLIKTLGKKTVGAYLAVTAVCAVGFGLLLDALIAAFGWDVAPIGDAMAGHGTSLLKIIAGVLFGLLLLRSMVMKLSARIKARHTHKAEADAVLRVEGMTCGHCAANVQHALEAVSGVQRAVVDEKQATAFVYGQSLDTDVLCAAVKAAGYDAAQKGEKS